MSYQILADVTESGMQQDEADAHAHETCSLRQVLRGSFADACAREGCVGGMIGTCVCSSVRLRGSGSPH